MRRIEDPDIRDRYPGSPQLNSGLPEWSKGVLCKRNARKFESCTGLYIFSYGATVARLILVQKIVVQIHVGKPGFEWVANGRFLPVLTRNLRVRASYVN